MPLPNRGRPKTLIGARLKPDEYAAFTTRVDDEGTTISAVLKRLLGDAGYLTTRSEPLPPEQK